jgi:alkyl hydroperoxide reductase subunit AhpC
MYAVGKGVAAGALILATLAWSGGSAGATESDTGQPAGVRPPAPRPVVKVGKPAPGFVLEAVVGEEFRKINLADYRGRWVVLFFYPLDFTLVCPTEIRGFNAAREQIRTLNGEFLAVSVDSKYSHLAWIERGDLGKLEFPLLSDFTKEVARSYGILDEETGAAQRGLFIIDPEGFIQHIVVHNGKVGRSVDETVRVLTALQTGELCPLGWKPGQKTLGK